jgi:hypothetical protein
MAGQRLCGHQERGQQRGPECLPALSASVADAFEELDCGFLRQRLRTCAIASRPECAAGAKPPDTPMSSASSWCGSIEEYCRNFIDEPLAFVQPVKLTSPVARRGCDRTASVMRTTIGLSSFQHCQYNGTSRCTSDIRTNEPSSSASAARLCGNMPQPNPHGPRHRKLQPSGQNAAAWRCRAETPCVAACPATRRHGSTPTTVPAPPPAR